MFSQKYKEEATEERFNSMKQLDRIEFLNKLIQQKQVLNSMKIGESVLLVCAFISTLSFANYFYSYLYLSSIGLKSYVHVSAVGNSLLVIMLFIFSVKILYLIRIFKINKFQKENDKALDFVLGKK